MLNYVMIFCMFQLSLQLYHPAPHLHARMAAHVKTKVATQHVDVLLVTMEKPVKVRLNSFMSASQSNSATVVCYCSDKLSRVVNVPVYTYT